MQQYNNGAPNTYVINDITLNNQMAACRNQDNDDESFDYFLFKRSPRELLKHWLKKVNKSAKNIH